MQCTLLIRNSATMMGDFELLYMYIIHVQVGSLEILSFSHTCENGLFELTTSVRHYYTRANISIGLKQIP